MTILNPGEASKQMQEMAAEVKALSDVHVIMQGDATIASALSIAMYRMQVAAHNYVQSCAPQQNPQQPAVRPQHRAPGTGNEGRPYSRTDVRPPSGGVGGGGPGVALPIPPLNTPPQAPQAPISRVSAAGHVPTAAGLPDAIVPPGAQLHPRTVARLRAAQGLPPEDPPPAADAGPVALAHDLPPTPGGDLPDLPMLDAPFPLPPPPSPYNPGAPPTR